MTIPVSGLLTILLWWILVKDNPTAAVPVGLLAMGTWLGVCWIGRRTTDDFIMVGIGAMCAFAIIGGLIVYGVPGFR